VAAAPAPLSGRTIALLETRRADEMAHLIQRQGGAVVNARLVREVAQDDDGPIEAWLDQLAAGRYHAVVFLTGVGCQLLLDRSTQSGRLPQVLAALGSSRLVARGPKPVRVLKEHNVRIDFVPPEPNTSDELLAEMATWSLRGHEVGVQLYGGPTPFLDRLMAGLGSLGAVVHPVSPYRWAGPQDPAAVHRLIDELVGGRVDALAILSASQIHTLFAFAEEHDRVGELQRALQRQELLIAAVGPVSAQAIRAHDLPVHLQPEHPKMGHLVMALCERLGAAEPLA
jgi:uroporphyrinogen-III synthase